MIVYSHFGLVLTHKTGSGLIYNRYGILDECKEYSFNIEKLDGSNYAYWKKQIYNVLVQKNQAKPICLASLKLAKRKDMNMDDWIELNEFARSTIMLTLHKSVYFNVKDTKGAYGVWQALSNLYEKKSAASQVFWLKKLIDVCKKETTPMSTHLNEFKTILSRLQAQEVEFQDFVKAMFLLVTLPDSWDTFCTTINNSTPKNGLKCANVESSLLMEELNCKNVDDSRSFNAMHVRGRQQSRGNHGSSEIKRNQRVKNVAGENFLASISR
ncbi:hypothetical protein L7F22_005234 [Adiantum nelumboides]|nr:hypothetical protein [Adiantum nelumboides]